MESICSANQWTGFCMITVSVMKGLRESSIYLTWKKSFLISVIKQIPFFNENMEIFKTLFICNGEDVVDDNNSLI